jgi:hypothetical protein
MWSLVNVTVTTPRALWYTVGVASGAPVAPEMVARPIVAVNTTTMVNKIALEVFNVRLNADVCLAQLRRTSNRRLR